MKNTKDLISLHDDVFEKFKEFEISTEQARKVKGGEGWLCFYQNEKKEIIYNSHPNSQLAVDNCSGRVQYDGYACVGCGTSSDYADEDLKNIGRPVDWAGNFLDK